MKMVYKAAKSRRFEMTTICLQDAVVMFVFVFCPSMIVLCCVVVWCVFVCVVTVKPFTLIQRNYPFILWLVKCNFFFLRDKIDVILPRTIYCCQHNLTLLRELCCNWSVDRATYNSLRLAQSCYVGFTAIGLILPRTLYSYQLDLWTRIHATHKWRPLGIVWVEMFRFKLFFWF